MRSLEPLQLGEAKRELVSYLSQKPSCALQPRLLIFIQRGEVTEHEAARPCGPAGHKYNCQRAWLHVITVDLSMESLCFCQRLSMFLVCNLTNRFCHFPFSLGGQNDYMHPVFLFLLLLKFDFGKRDVDSWKQICDSRNWRVWLLLKD